MTEAIERGARALAEPLTAYARHEWVLQCPTDTCPTRRVPMATVASRRPDATVGQALDRLRCSGCGERPDVAGLYAIGADSRPDWLLLRRGAGPWRKRATTQNGP